MGRIQLTLPGHDQPVVIDLTLNGSALTVGCHKPDTDSPQTLQARIISQKENQGLLEIDGQVVPYYTAYSDPGKKMVQIWVLGNLYTFEKIPIGAKRSRGGNQGISNASGDLKATMPGKVLGIKVTVGDSVSPDDTIIIMESMKMEMSLNAPFKGIVKSIGVNEGDVVEINTLLAQLQPETIND